MTRRLLVRSVIPWLLAGAIASRPEPPAPGPAPNSDEAAIRSLIANYAKSVDAADTTLASTVWASTPDVSFIHPRGHERGLAAIKANFYEQTMRQSFSERKLNVKDVAISCYGDAAWAE